ncbi:MBL fold metallo-hydrolase [Streptomyces gibsoniae]|uniref:MBL fold metallo-hydrolase n=1 Tax=Streptomyces gibsoniae TaxID=3075529 RepID=A0ABU2U290_9ACTN|nr:MBL fold metallo-hydrolase [Streptomyces sp. DSM 41699]MDT0467343.1 MBL fold metallo-hydrolase [Streptomyces sp. DSM 41699]
MFDRDPLVVLTHAHLDHVGGVHGFREREPNIPPRSSPSWRSAAARCSPAT